MAYVGYPLSWLEKVTAEIIKIGPLPRHVGFIMDGNRRYAKKNNMTMANGFLNGAYRIEWTVNWALKLGIQEITLYAFSIENYKRTKHELNIFMEGSITIFQRILDKVDVFNKLGVCIRILGSWKLIDEELRKKLARIMLATKKNDKFILNIAFAYSSRDDITNAIKRMVEGVENGLLNINDINEELMSNCLYTHKSSAIDLVIRTSGVARFSDFMLWNLDRSISYNFSIYWPEFTFWSLSKAILYYQYHYSYWNKTQNQIKNIRIKTSEEKCSTFLAYINERHWAQIEAYAQN